MSNEIPLSTTYDIRHVTTYDYRFATPFARCIVRLMPVDRPGQRVLKTTLSVDPNPDIRQESFDTMGNRLTRIAFHLPHRRLTLTATARVETCHGTMSDDVIHASPAWETTADAVLSDRRLSGLAPINFLFASRYVPLLSAVTAFTSQSVFEGRPIIAAALDLAKRIHDEFTYDSSATTITTPLTEVFTQKHGVCQDFAHLMISGLRSLGIPAAYVSGYLRTQPPPGQARLEGADAMHAWVAVWSGDELGWVGLDPTNGILAGNSHIVVAIGRDYADVSPIDGFVVTSGDQTMRVAVDVIEVSKAEVTAMPDQSSTANEPA